MLVGFQDAFVALAADAGLRRAFAADAARVLGSFELDAREREVLRAIPIEALERYARSLVAKRWSELARVVPLSMRVAPSLPARYRGWALEHPARVPGEERATVLSPGAAEGLRAEVAMRDALAAESEAAYAPDLWTFEVRRAATRGDGESRGMTSRFSIAEIAGDVHRGLLPIDPEPRPTLIRFERERVVWSHR